MLETGKKNHAYNLYQRNTSFLHLYLQYNKYCYLNLIVKIHPYINIINIIFLIELQAYKGH